MAVQLGAAAGGRAVSGLWVGTDEGARPVTGGWIGTVDGARRFFSAAPEAAPLSLDLGPSGWGGGPHDWSATCGVAVSGGTPPYVLTEFSATGAAVDASFDIESWTAFLEAGEAFQPLDCVVSVRVRDGAGAEAFASVAVGGS